MPTIISPGSWQASPHIRGGWQLDGVGTVVPLRERWVARGSGRGRQRLGAFDSLHEAQAALERHAILAR